MNKILRYTFMTLLMMVCGMVSADVITFDPAVDMGTQAGSSQGEDQVTKSGVTIAASPTGSFGNGQQYRVYKGSNFTVTSTVGNITKVEVTCTASGEEKYGPGCFVNPTAGSYAFEGKVGTWTGDASSFSLTAESNQVRMTLVKVTIGEGGDPGPGPGPDPQPGNPTGSGTLADPWNAVAANNFVAALAADTPTEQDYYIQGKIAKIANNGTFSDKFGNATFYISDDGADANTFYIYRTLYLENKLWVEGNTQIKEGDEVIICGKLVNYKGDTPETVQNQSYIYSLNGVTSEGGHEEPPVEGAIVFDAAVDLGSQASGSSGEDQVSKNGVTIAVSPTGSFGNGQQFRVYKGSTFTVTSTVGDITKIVVTCTASGEEKYGPGCFVNPTSGTYTYDGNTGTWTGSAATVSLTAESNQVRMTKIEVYVGEASQKFLTISGTTPFTTSTTVTITPSNPDYAVYYTLDGSDPRSSGTQKVYSTPFTLTATTTVKAVEEDLAGELSEVVEKTFVKEEGPEIQTVENIAAFKALETGTEAKLKLNNAQVLYASGKDVFVRDGSGAIEFYNTGIDFVNNQVLNGDITGKFSPYNGLPELASTSNTTADSFTATAGSEPQPVDVTISQLGESLLCDLVRLSLVDIVENEGNTYATKDGESIQLYDKFKIIDPSTIEGNSFTVVGILVVYKGNYQIYPTYIQSTVGIHNVNMAIDTNAPLYNLSGQKVSSDYKGVVIQKGKKIILK